MDLFALANAAVTTLSPIVGKMASKTAEDLADVAEQRLVSWFRQKPCAKPETSLASFELDPNDDFKQKILTAEVAKYLHSNPDQIVSLQTLLTSLKPEPATMKANAEHGSAIAQINGFGNNINQATRRVEKRRRE